MTLKCLVVEDDIFTRNILTIALKKDDFIVDTVDGGEAALAYLEQQPLPDVILLDLHMPNINGYDVINIIRNDKNLEDIVIIVVTANPSAISTTEVHQADGFLTKPIDIHRLNQTIMEVFHKRHG